ncbi:MAG: hypothetical protein AB7P16_28650 [Bradyrhizobium sp.]|uniref:hypothetical protein n=1 Tax=Bradyrhizobium sp. TaxID=376 RepID=UPI003D0DF1D5
MSRYVVKKPFNTANRRFQVGQIVTRDDLSEDQMEFEERQRRFLAGEDTKAADAAAHRASDADGPLLTGSPEPLPPTGIEDRPTPEPGPAEPEMKKPGRRR